MMLGSWLCGLVVLAIPTAGHRIDRSDRTQSLSSGPKMSPSDLEEFTAANFTQLHFAAAENDATTAEMLLSGDAPADVNAETSKDEGSMTPLDLAMGEDVEKVLEEHGGRRSKQAQEDKPYKPLHRAGMNGYLKVAKLLVSAKADIDVRDDGGMTPTMLAAAWEVEDIHTLQFLVEAGAQVNLQSDSNRTVLDWARVFHRTAAEKFLLAHGAKCNREC
mmetsp:Transcript_46467/g.86875  ORF Transcript_46467/g.86875 Transcript_46467/m.86875 type:complete len:218 (-) Transcript_46467:18-671(-)